MKSIRIFVSLLFLVLFYCCQNDDFTSLTNTDESLDTTSVSTRCIKSGIKIAILSDIHVHQWQPYKFLPDLTAVEALEHILAYMNRNGLEVLHSSTQIIIAPGYEYHIVKAMVTNFHQPQSTLLLLVSAFVHAIMLKLLLLCQ